MPDIIKRYRNRNLPDECSCLASVWGGDWHRGCLNEQATDGFRYHITIT